METTPGSGARRFVVRGADGAEAPIGELRDAYRQGFVFEIFNTQTGKTIDDGVFVTVINPTRYNLSEPHQGVLTPTDNDTVVVEERGIVTRQITLEGTFGVSEKRASGFVGAQGNGQALSGTEHFNRFRNFFRRYSALKKDPRTNATHIMVFHALRDNDHFIVAKPVFETPRDAGRNRVHYEYRLTLTAVQEATRSGLIPADQTLDGNAFFDALQVLNDAFLDARAFFAEVNANIGDVRRKVQNIQTVMINAAQVINSVGNAISTGAKLIQIPIQFVANTATLIANAGDQLADSIDPETNGILFENVRSLRMLESALDRIAMFEDRFEAAGENLGNLFFGEQSLSQDDILGGAGASAPGQDGSGGATVGSRVRNSGANRSNGLDVPSGQGFVEVLITRTDTLETIANAARTTPEALIVINDLSPPYITAAGGPGLLQPGDVILVPGSRAGGSAPRGANDYLTTEEAVYGRDLALDPKLLEQDILDISVNDTQGSDDAELARGVANVVQGITITIGTERGTTTFIPELGIRRNVGSKGTTQRVLLASITLQEAILADPRIDSIDSSRVIYDANTGELTQEVTPILVGATSGVTFALPVGKASDGSL